MSTQKQYILCYNLYDLIKNVYVYSHMDYYLINKEKQKWECIFITLLGFFLILINLVVLFKILIIVIYFFIFKIIINFSNFIITLIKTKLKINWKSYFINMLLFVKNIFYKLYFYNFYKYDNMLLSIIFLIFYLIFIFSNLIFFKYEIKEIGNKEKSQLFIISHFMSFESYLIIEITCCILYSMRNLVYQFILIVLFNLFINLIIIIKYYIYIISLYEPLEELNIIYNIIFCFIFMLLYLTTIINIKNQNKKSKEYI